MYFAVAWEEPRMVINESAVEWRDARTGPTDVSNNREISNSSTANHSTIQPTSQLRENFPEETAFLLGIVQITPPPPPCT